jgi:hypothetical protein
MWQFDPNNLTFVSMKENVLLFNLSIRNWEVYFMQMIKLYIIIKLPWFTSGLNYNSVESGA